ncbi:MAG: hypothetical protein AYP45_14375 [Candidatus Brocadia carolinensis]|uniref:Uncharacterized protein n=1 Tax=Candidatus Brocadia carolinensis TaxID=1004156 RepID=A0A1V4AQX6_9BACT|nr:MAG: hypothetical protein AYP45_14375 [Candidatus Brocadia caroliniensis]
MCLQGQHTIGYQSIACVIAGVFSEAIYRFLKEKLVAALRCYDRWRFCDENDRLLYKRKTGNDNIRIQNYAREAKCHYQP